MTKLSLRLLFVTHLRMTWVSCCAIFGWSRWTALRPSAAERVHQAVLGYCVGCYSNASPVLPTLYSSRRKLSSAACGGLIAVVKSDSADSR